MNYLHFKKLSTRIDAVSNPLIFSSFQQKIFNRHADVHWFPAKQINALITQG